MFGILNFLILWNKINEFLSQTEKRKGPGLFSSTGSEISTSRYLNA